MKSHSPNNLCYLDYNATHPPFETVLKKGLDEYLSNYYNPSGITRFSLQNQAKIERARKYFANLTNKNETNFVFSSTGTEANYLLIKALRSQHPTIDSVYVSPFEHSSMYAALNEFGFRYDFIFTDKSGIINIQDLDAKLKNFSKPVICLYAGNETGVIQPMEEISNLTKKYASILISDLMQCFGKISFPFEILDGFSFSGHKIGGGMGAALTYFPKMNASMQLFSGGNQENGHRAGTENIFAIDCFQKVSEIQIENLSEKNKRLLTFRNQIEFKLKNLGCEIICENSERLPNTSFVRLPIQSVDFFLLGMEENGILISTGSSCKSRAREASGSLLRMGYSEEEALQCVRISTGFFTTEDHIYKLLETFENLLVKFSVSK
ncbi:aminotransferase class V-fold PLP-dependent enzyme [Leptospira sp. 96542]|nr:aminotransferase class V-fold PLP-dependent enzyme [Leptospira sp. 96542]